MKRIMIIGSCGSGKSTLSRKIQEMTSLPLYHLDQFYWQPNWTETPNAEWENIVIDLANKAEWIIDGNYGGTMDIRIQKADTIVFLDISTIKCLGRVIKRIWTYHGQIRPDMPAGCKERFDLEFLHYVATYNILRRKNLLKMMEEAKQDKQTYILRNDQDIHTFLAEIND